MIDLANKENNLIIKENNYIESIQLSKSIFPQIMGKIIQFTGLIDNLYSAYIQLKYRQEINSLQNGILKNRIDHLSEEYDHSIKRKQINEDLIQERTILKARITTQNRELDLAKSNNLLLKQNIQSIILNFNHIRNIHVGNKYTPNEIYHQELVILKEQNSQLKNNKVILKAEIARINENKMNLKSSLIFFLHSRHTNSDMVTNADDLSNRFMKMKYEDLVYQQKLFVENMNNKLNDLSWLKHTIMENKRANARRTVCGLPLSLAPTNEIEHLIDKNTIKSEQLFTLEEDMKVLNSRFSNLQIEYNLCGCDPLLNDDDDDEEFVEPVTDRDDDTPATWH